MRIDPFGQVGSSASIPAPPKNDGQAPASTDADEKLTAHAHQATS